MQANCNKFEKAGLLHTGGDVILAVIMGFNSNINCSKYFIAICMLLFCCMGVH